MTIEINTPGVHRIALRVTDLERAKRFYIQTLGFSPLLEADNLFIFAAGSSAVAVRGPDPLLIKNVSIGWAQIEELHPLAGPSAPSAPRRKYRASRPQS